MPRPLSEAEVEPRRSPSVRATPDLWHHLGVPLLFAALALGFRQDLVFLLGALVVGCALLAAPLCWRNLRDVRVRRQLPARARAGVPAWVAIEISNPGPEPAVGLELEQGHPRQATPAAGRVEVPCLGPRREVRGRVEVTFLARGRHTLPAAQLTSRYPLGAFRARMPACPPEELLVWPREGRPTPALLERLGGGGARELLRPSHARGADDLVGVREWREGDDPRRVHAASSARRGDLLVTDWRRLPGHETLLVLGRLAGAPQGQLFERGVSIAASVWSALEHARRPAELLVGAHVVRPGPGAHARGLDLLALARPRAIAPAAARLEALAARPAPRHVIVVGGPEDRALLAAARRAAGPHGLAWLLDARAPQAERWVRGLPA